MDKIGALPACKIIRVTGWADPDMFCEVETDAFVKHPPLLYIHG